MFLNFKALSGGVLYQLYGTDMCLLPILFEYWTSNCLMLNLVNNLCYNGENEKIYS